MLSSATADVITALDKLITHAHGLYIKPTILASPHLTLPYLTLPSGVDVAHIYDTQRSGRLGGPIACPR